MRRGRPIAPLSLAVEERASLERWARRPKSAQALAQRARIVLACGSGKPNTVVARQLGVTHQTVGKWRQRFLERRLEGLLDEPRPGAPRQVSDAGVERVVRLTLESTPPDATHWSTRAMAKRCGMSQTMISRIWRAFALQPHRTEGFKLLELTRFGGVCLAEKQGGVAAEDTSPIPSRVSAADGRTSARGTFAERVGA
jgi:transposase